jgi:predicted nucleic acid-binding protein
MKILLDTNLLTRMVEPAHRQHRAAMDATDLLGKQGHKLIIVPQVIYEFWVVCTRPLSVNGLGQTVAAAEIELANFKSLFTILGDSPLILAEWEKLVVALQISGKTAHDARLVAAMAVHGVTHLLTFNDQDFHRYSNITVLTPASVVAPPTSP